MGISKYTDSLGPFCEGHALTCHGAEMPMLLIPDTLSNQGQQCPDSLRICSSGRG